MLTYAALFVLPRLKAVLGLLLLLRPWLRRPARLARLLLGAVPGRVAPPFIHAPPAFPQVHIFGPFGVRRQAHVNVHGVVRAAAFDHGQWRRKRAQILICVGQFLGVEVECAKDVVGRSLLNVHGRRRRFEPNDVHFTVGRLDDVGAVVELGAVRYAVQKDFPQWSAKLERAFLARPLGDELVDRAVKGDGNRFLARDTAEKALLLAKASLVAKNDSKACSCPCLFPSNVRQ